MHNRKYCCYRHFTEGKHEPSCTHCLTHVQLGVINPPHSPGKTPNNRQVPPLNITSTQFRIENRTHDYNEVQNKDSLPDRLKQPRLYVEKVLEKGKRESFVLPGKKSGSVEYEMLVKLYRKIGQCLKQKSKRSLLDLIRGHCIEHRYIRSSKQPIFLTKSQFVQMIVACFNKFSHTEAEQFWQIGYNELRFKQKLSVEAFVYNFDKFYIQLLNYNNTFSQAALRQRMIDLRVALFDWAQNQVCLKYNIKIIKDDIMDIEDMLKLSQDQELYFDFHSAVENCRLAHIKLRYLAEILFNLTDTKFLTLKKLKSSLHNKIEQRSRRLATSRQVLHNFFQTQDLLPTDKFAITDILQYCKTENSSQQVIADMISWIQGVFDFMFFYENDYDNEELGLGLNFTTRRLQCQKILEIDAQVVQNFDRFLERIFDMQIDVCRNLIAVVEGAMDKMPLLQGHKKEIVECNYLSETVLRFIRQISLKPFWWIVRITTQCRYQKQLKRISQILKTDPTEEEVKKNMKGLFTLSAPPLQINDKSSLKSNISEKDEVQYSLKKFERIKQEQLILKLKMPQIEEQKNKKEEYGEIQNLLRMEENREKKLDENCEVCGENHVEKCKQIVEKDKDEKGIGGFIFCGSKYWHEASKQTNSTIASIEDMQSRLFNLLNLSI